MTNDQDSMPVDMGFWRIGIGSEPSGTAVRPVGRDITPDGMTFKRIDRDIWWISANIVPYRRATMPIGMASEPID